MLASALATDARGSRSDAVLRRFSGPTRRPAFWIALWTIAAAVELAAIASIVFADEPVPGYRGLFRLIGGVFVACGLIGWRRRPDSHSGPLMVAMGFGLLVEPVFALFETPAIRLFGDLLEDSWGIAAIALLLSFLNGGRIEGRAERVLLGAVVLQTVAEFLRHLFLERDGNFLLVHADAAIADAFVAIFALLKQRRRAGRAAARRRKVRRLAGRRRPGLRRGAPRGPRADRGGRRRGHDRARAGAAAELAAAR